MLKQSMLKQLRNRLGISQETLAQHFKVPVFQISRWETGRVGFSLNLQQIKALIRLIRAVGLDYEDLPDDIFGDLPLFDHTIMS
jgi:DNA-binding transcriptional regulator YiaG